MTKDLLKEFFTRRRTYGVYLLSILAVGYLFYTDPDRGGSTRDMLESFMTAGLAFTAAHVLRKFFLDYIKLEDHVSAAKGGSIGAGLVVLAVVIFTCTAALVFSTRAHAADDVRTYVPENAKVYIPMLHAEQVRLWPTHPQPSALFSLAEQESCITLRHRMCWNPGAKLKTSREEGAGIFQITRAYREDGSLRFDALAATKALDPSLSDWSWSNVYTRPDLQLRAVVVMNRDCFNRLARLVKDPQQVLYMCDSAYNGGFGGMQAERRACGEREDCDPQKWFGNVEKTCLKSKVAWKGYGKSACEINREHVDYVFNLRREKYYKLIW